MRGFLELLGLKKPSYDDETLPKKGNGCKHDFNWGNGLYCKKCKKRWSKKDEC